MHMALRDLFAQTLAELQQMQLVLEQEALGLKDRDAEALEKSTRQKQALAYNLEALSERQENFLRAQNLPAGKEGIESILYAHPSTNPATSSMRAIWRDIQNLTAACQKLNEVNGAYIGLLRQHVQRSLDIVHGQSSQDVVYGPDGIGHRPTSSRKLLSV
jgi:flagellar biosynthesis/type III secretory pathway chaperone